MDEKKNYLKRSQVPAFGSWDCENDNFPIPFTECFESAALRYSQGSDFYVYHNHILTPTIILVPPPKKKASSRKDAWVMCDCEKESAVPVPPTARRVPKNPVDEDLYKISPDLLYSKSKMKGIRGFISSCLLPTCAC